MKYYFEILEMLSILVVFSGVIILGLLIGTLDFLRNKHKIIMASFLFVLLYLALLELDGIFKNIIHNLK